MKKIISYLLISIFCFNIFGINNILGFDEEENYVKEIALKKGELSKSKKGDQYVKAIDTFIEANENNEKKLLEINSRLENIIYSGELKNNDLGNTIRYLNAKVNIAIINIEENKINTILNPTISESDKNIASERILKLQGNLANSSKTLIEKLTKEFESLNNYSETGNLKISLDIDEKNIGKINSSIELSNYEATANNFDSQLKGQLKAILDAIPAGQEQIKFELNTFVDFISKDGNIYLLLKDLNILNDKGIEDEVKLFINTFENLAKENKYIVFEDKNSQMSIELLKSLNPATLGADINKTLSEPLFEAYKKEGNKYYIKPTKYSCDKIKELESRFDPLYGKECSDSQYKDMLKDFNDLGIIYLIIDGENNTLGFDGKKDSQIEKNSGYITFNNKEILNANYEIIPNQNRYPNEFFKANYLSRSNIKVDFYADGGDLDTKLYIKLNSNNLISSIDLKSKMYETELVSNINVANQSISGKTTFSENGEKIFEVDTTGKYTKETLELNNKFNINDKNLNNYLGNNISGNLNIKTDVSSGKNNFYMIFDIISNNSKLIKFEIDNKANRKSGNYEIKTPTNTIDYKEAFGIPDYNDEYYYDDSYYYEDDYYYDY
ncbi:MAG: hypothetical protein PHI37_00045 [Candidatus Gracilibacteria bacterium]|nr:hypothetical protein [Candidatus Gracilibacteria bacterium]